MFLLRACAVVRREQHAAADVRRHVPLLVAVCVQRGLRADVLRQLDLDGLRGRSAASVSRQRIDGWVGRGILFLAPLRVQQRVCARFGRGPDAAELQRRCAAAVRPRSVVLVGCRVSLVAALRLLRLWFRARLRQLDSRTPQLRARQPTSVRAKCDALLATLQRGLLVHLHVQPGLHGQHRSQRHERVHSAAAGARVGDADHVCGCNVYDGRCQARVRGRLARSVPDRLLLAVTLNVVHCVAEGGRAGAR